MASTVHFGEQLSKLLSLVLELEYEAFLIKKRPMHICMHGEKFLLSIPIFLEAL